MTRYVIGSLDSPIYFAGWAVPHSGRGTFTPYESSAFPYDFMTSASLELAILETKDQNARALNLVVIPVRIDIKTDSSQMQLL